MPEGTFNGSRLIWCFRSAHRLTRAARLTDSSSTGSVYYANGRIPAFPDPILMHGAPGWRLSAFSRHIAVPEKIPEGNYHSLPELLRTPPGRLKNAQPGCKSNEENCKRFYLLKRSEAFSSGMPAFTVPLKSFCYGQPCSGACQMAEQRLLPITPQDESR